MDHRTCLNEIRRRASEGLIGMISAFLYDRKMTVCVEDEFSTPRTVPGGSPQGSILANYLFCITVDSLSNDANPQPAVSPTKLLPRPRLPPIGAEARTSTPRRPTPTRETSSSDSDASSGADDSFRFFRLRRPFTMESSGEESFLMPQPEINLELGVPERWVDTPVTVQCYIDDFNNIEKVQIEGAITHITHGRRKCLVHAYKSERLFATVERAAEEKKMRVNAAKTQMICINASSDDVRSYMNLNGKRVLSGDNLKILGFTFGRRPTVHAHVNALLTRLRRRLWLISNLKFSGMKVKGLLHIYYSLVRSVADFACPAYHSLLTSEQSDALERIQRRAVKTIFGYEYSYNTILSHQNIKKLSARREELLRKFAVKASRNEKFTHWFPLAEETGHNTRTKKKYKEFMPKTERMKRSPIYTMRRILNELND